MHKFLCFFLFIFFFLIYTHPLYAQEARALKIQGDIHILHLDYANAKHLASILSSVLSNDNRVVAYSPTNCLIIKDSSSTYTHPPYPEMGNPSKDPMIIQVIHLDYADADYLSSVLAPLLSKDGRIVAYSPTNCLIIKDRTSIVKRLVKIIKGNTEP